ncbi:MAG: tetratricopeptide repeat protein, partial [Bryobacteraceae bacterium]
VGKREEALGTAQEAVDLRRKLAKGNPDAFLPYLAMSLNNLAIRQSEVGKREEALGTAQEAVDLRRKLAKRNPDAFLPDLAMSLAVLGTCHSGLDQHSAAVESFRESIATLMPYFRDLPGAHAGPIADTARDYLAACEKCGQPPDMALLAPIIEVSQRIPPAPG